MMGVLKQTQRAIKNAIRRRDILAYCASAALPISVAAQTLTTGGTIKILSESLGLVRKGQDRLGKERSVGLSKTAFKVVTADTKGALFVMENVISKRGGPPLHLHHNEDEYFYVLEGEFIVEIGGQRFQLGPGDSVLGPRQIPHAYAFVGSDAGRLLLTYAPANRMEEYFASRGEGSRYSTDAERFRAFGMELLGPPIALDH
jgi:mannose-6-phosphate isomerase-like protein (cupin superfamily)